MISFEGANIITSLIVGTYGISILVFPDLFFSSYIYNKGFWEHFKGSIASGGPYSVLISEHLIKGIGLTWIAWALFYVCISMVPVHNEALFAKVNVFIWLLWILLDRWVRKVNLYSPIASFLNALVVTGVFSMWLTISLLSQ